MGVTSYLVVGGEIISETRSGVKSDYIPDPLGSTSALINSSGTITDTFTYWPYGQRRSHVGPSVTPFGYCGTLGYYTSEAYGWLYVRARIVMPSLMRWLTVDGLWPWQRAYVYVEDNPVTWVDASGALPVLICRYLCRDKASNDYRNQRDKCWTYYADEMAECGKNDWRCRAEAARTLSNCLKGAKWRYERDLRRCP